MPKTAIDENCKPLLPENQIGHHPHAVGEPQLLD
jgi:hypothetical protein